MSGFLTPAQFSPIEPVLPNGTAGQVLTIVSGRRAWAAGGGGSGGSLGPLQTFIAAAGANNNVAATAGVGRLDVSTAAGAANITGIAAGTDGQLLNVRNTGANLLTLNSDNAGSLSANQIQLPADLSLPQYDALLLCYYGGSINKWCLA